MQTIDSLSMLLPPTMRAAAAPVNQTASLPTWLFSPWFTVPVAGLVLLVAYYFMRRSIRQEALAVAAQMAKEEAKRLEAESLRASNEYLLGLLRQRDRYLVQYEAVSMLDEEEYRKWATASWKTVACNQLALTKAVRPLLYADYRSRVRLLSETYATGPRPTLRYLKQQLDWQLLPMPEMEEPDFLTDSTGATPVAVEEGSLLAEPLSWVDAERSTTAVPLTLEPTPLPNELSTLFATHLDERNREVEALFFKED